MGEQHEERSADQPAEGGGLDGDDEQGVEPSSDEPVESGGLQDEQQGKGYGAG